MDAKVIRFSNIVIDEATGLRIFDENSFIKKLLVTYKN